MEGMEDFGIMQKKMEDENEITQKIHMKGFGEEKGILLYL